MYSADFAERLGLGPEHDAGEVSEGRVRAAQGEGGPPVEVPLERSTVTFRDVGGMESVKEEVSLKIILPLTHPELYKAYGKAVGGGILLYGPPGCGKTHLARATAGEVKAHFLAVGLPPPRSPC